MSDKSWQELLEELESRRARATQMGGPERIERERKLGRNPVRTRLELLLDADSFTEFGRLTTMPAEDGNGASPTSFICGVGRIDGRPVAVGAEDFTVQGGAAGVHLSESKGQFGGFIEEISHAYRVPLVLLLQGVGGSLLTQEAKGYAPLLAGFEMFPIMELLSEVPVVAGVFGPTAGSSAARAVAAHFSVMSEENGCLFVGGPPVVKDALGLEIDKFELGGADVHARGSGVIDNAADSEAEMLGQMRRFLAFLPSDCHHLPPTGQASKQPERNPEELLDLVPSSGRRPYDVHKVIEAIVDGSSFFEIAPKFGRAVCVGLARIDGYPVAIVASNPMHNAAAIDGPAADKQARFVEMADTFHLPIVYLADVPGFMIGPGAEKSGVLRRGMRAIQAIRRATVPVFTIQMRRSFGLAAAATGNTDGRSLRLAWPTGVWGDLPSRGGVEAAYRNTIESSADPEGTRAALIDRFDQINSIWKSVELFAGVEEVIDPRETRDFLTRLVALTYETALPAAKQGPQVRV
ncbi:MAG: hypothetical protein JST53_02650 [Actinobacteria bacterium]|nr:hypothetical protein [Actinomycetota bacterium]